MKAIYTVLFLCLCVIPYTQVSGDFDGDIKSKTLESTGNRHVIADQEGVLKVGSNVLTPLHPSEGELLYFDGSTWLLIPVGHQGEALTFCNNMPIWGPCSSLTISVHNAEQITTTSAKIRWTSSEYVQGYVEYGTTTSYGQRTIGETSFTYATHLQGITDLQAGTTYYYRIHINSASGVMASATGSFTTNGNLAESDYPMTGEFQNVRSAHLIGHGERDVYADQHGILRAGMGLLPPNPIEGEMVYFNGTIWQAIPVGTQGQTLYFCNGMPAWGPCYVANISSFGAEQITQTSAKIWWTASENVQGYVEYGTTTSYGQRTVGETSFTYATHLQGITGLQHGTTYYYQIHSTTQSGEEIRASGSFMTISNSNQTACNDGIDNDGDGQIDLNDSDCTSETDDSESTPQPPSGWPSSVDAYDENLPMSGIFYGKTKSGIQAGNSSIDREHSIRFRAQRTGHIDALRYNNRMMTDSQMQGRCNAGGSSSESYCDCIDAGLTARQCGFTLSNFYQVGTGGRYTIMVEADDETANHEPTGVVLGQTNTFVPEQIVDQGVYPIFPLQSPVYVEAGKMYHLHFVNSDPPSCDNGGGSNYRGNSLEEALTCTGGAISINGLQQPISGESVGHTTGLYGPFIGSASGVLHRGSPSSTWKLSTYVIPFYELRYESDGVWIGEATSGAYNWNLGRLIDGTQIIDGDKKGRQEFTVVDVSRTVNGLWVNFGHTNNMVSGQPMTVKVQDANGLLLATGSIPYSETCKILVGSENKLEKFCKAWGYTDLSSNVVLQEGTTYFVEFSAPTNAGFTLATHYPLNYNPYFSTNLNEWKESRARYKRGANAQWGGWGLWDNGNPAWPERDIPMMFTLEGMPKSME